MASSGGTRVYKPLQPRDNRHFSNCKQGNVLGMSSLFDHSFCVITSSMKDGVVLNTFGIPAVAPATSEVDMISKHYIDTLVLRYGKVYVMMDNDEAGLKTNQRYAEQYSLEYKMFEGASDISDYRAAFGEVATRSLINSLFNVSR